LEGIMAKASDRTRTEQERYPEMFFTGPKGHPKDRIKINESSELPKEGIFFGLNGYQYLAKPGVEIDIPRPVRLMLDTRIRTENLRTDNGNGTVEVHTRNIPRITYTLIKENVDMQEPLPTEAMAESNAGVEDF
jgi:hypothetical protein